jgi:hypothetical protein
MIVMILDHDDDNNINLLTTLKLPFPSLLQLYDNVIRIFASGSDVRYLRKTRQPCSDCIQPNEYAFGCLSEIN